MSGPGPLIRAGDVVRQSPYWHIYAIGFDSSSKVYIGSTTNWGNRVRHHFWALRKGKHKNKYLQNAYNCYGKDCVWVRSVETIDKNHSQDVVLVRERFWIKAFRANDKRYGMNLREDPTKSGTFGKESTLANKEKRSMAQKKAWSSKDSSLRKAFTLYDGNGKRYEIVDLPNFCRKHGLIYDKMYSVATGACVEHLGWKSCLNRTNKSLRNFRIQSPSGQIHSGSNFSQFCRNNKLSESKMRAVLNGCTKICLGWRLPDMEPSFYRKRSKTFTLQHESGAIVTIENLAKWCRSQNRKTWDVSLLRGDTSNGWKIIKRHD